MFPLLFWYIYISSCFRSPSCPVAHLCDRPALMCCTCCLPSPGLFKSASSPPLLLACVTVAAFQFCPLLFSFSRLCFADSDAFVLFWLMTHVPAWPATDSVCSVDPLVVCAWQCSLFLLDLARHIHIFIILYQIIIEQRPSICSFRETPFMSHECKARLKCF